MWRRSKRSPAHATSLAHPHTYFCRFFCCAPDALCTTPKQVTIRAPERLLADKYLEVVAATGAGGWWLWLLRYIDPLAFAVVGLVAPDPKIQLALVAGRFKSDEDEERIGV